MKKYFFFFLLLFLVVTHLNAQQTPPANVVLKEALATAAKDNKKVMVIFHASWCGWCRKMDASLNDPLVKAYFEKNYVITHLTIMESKDKKNLENPGALELKKKWGGGDIESIPYWVILDQEGNLLADSQIAPGKNVGCPATVEEVEHLIAALKSTSSISNDQIEAVRNRFRRNE